MSACQSEINYDRMEKKSKELAIRVPRPDSFCTIDTDQIVFEEGT